MGDLSDSSPSVLAGYIREPDLAQQLNRSVRTLQRLAARRLGPPRIKIGHLVFYKVDSVRAWLEQHEQPHKPALSVRPYVRQLKRGQKPITTVGWT
jgi:predicted DNA-binding transcriptional regulator AlpA